METTETTESGINWNTTRAEHDLIVLIAKRAEKLAKQLTVRCRDRSTLLMDLQACHCNGMPLDLERFLSFPDFDFTHDVWGIGNHIDRDTGKLMNCFVPRCAKVQRVVEGATES